MTNINSRKESMNKTDELNGMKNIALLGQIKINVSSLNTEWIKIMKGKTMVIGSLSG